MSFLSGLLEAAGAAAPYAANALAAKNQAAAQGLAEQRQTMFQALALQRQPREQAIQDALRQAQTRYYDQRTTNAGLVPVEIKPGGDGQYYSLPRRVAPSQPVGLAAPEAMRHGGIIPSPSVGQQPTTIGGVGARSTGVPVPVSRQPAPRSGTGMVNGRAVVGTIGPNGLFSADTTAQGDTVYARPRAARSGSASDPDATQLNHAITSVRSQIADTQRQQNALQATIRAANEPFATPEAKAAGAAAQAQSQALATRLDSLRGVQDQQIQRQQQSAGFRGVPVLVKPRNNVSPNAYQLSPADTDAMQHEFDQASQDLQSVLNSSAPDSIKQQARTLYNQHQLEIARKYSAHRQGSR